MSNKGRAEGTVGSPWFPFLHERQGAKRIDLDTLQVRQPRRKLASQVSVRLPLEQFDMQDFGSFWFSKTLGHPLESCALLEPILSESCNAQHRDILGRISETVQNGRVVVRAKRQAFEV